MSDLLPELWLDQKAEEGTAKQTNRSTAKKRVQDINVWLQCYAMYIGVMATKFPNMVLELMAYMISILRASQEYEGLAWATYDAAYHWQAAATGHKQWSKVNSSLYTICFMGKAIKATRCDLCLSTTHKTLECSQAIDEDPHLGQCLKAVELAVITFSANPHASQEPKASTHLKCPSSSIKNGASFATASTGMSAGCVRATTQHQNAPL